MAVRQHIRITLSPVLHRSHHEVVEHLLCTKGTAGAPVWKQEGKDLSWKRKSQACHCLSFNWGAWLWMQLDQRAAYMHVCLWAAAD